MSWASNATPSIWSISETSSSQAKQASPKTLTVLGGPHPTAVPQETMEFLGPSLDFAFSGEAEIGFPLFLEELGKERPNFGEVPGLVWRQNGSTHVNPKMEVQELDSLGIPAWDLIRPDLYPEAQHGAYYKRYPIAPIMATRGCPYLCTFCGSAGTKLRRRSVDHVLGEIKLLYHDYGIREFHLIDDNFTLDKKYARDFFSRIIAEKLDISMATPNGIRLDRVDPDLLKLMKRAGVYLISVGIESGSDRVLTLMKKSLTVEKIRTNLKMVRAAGMEVAGFFILGYPGETRAEMEQTIRFSRQLDLTRANFFTYLPLPGTESHRQIEAQGELDKVDWRRFYFMNAAYVPEGTTRKELKSLQRKAFLLFYLRPHIFFKNLLGIRSRRHFQFLLKRFYHWILMHPDQEFKMRRAPQ